MDGRLTYLSFATSPHPTLPLPVRFCFLEGITRLRAEAQRASLPRCFEARREAGY